MDFFQLEKLTQKEIIPVQGKTYPFRKSRYRFKTLMFFILFGKYFEWRGEKEDEAKEYFKKAYVLLSKMNWLVSSEPDRIERIKKLSE